MDAYIAGCNSETFVVIQIETREALHHVNAIAAVPGVDALFVGPGDLGVRLKESGGNVPGAPFHTTMGMPEALEKVAEACRATGKAWGLPAGTPDDLARYYSLGATVVNYGGDFGFCMSGLQDSAKVLDAANGSGSAAAVGDESADSHAGMP